MAPLDKTIPRLSGLDGEGSVQVHQDPDMKIEGAKVFSVYGKGRHRKINDKFQFVSGLF